MNNICVLGYLDLSWGVLGYPGVSWGNQTDPFFSFRWFLIYFITTPAVFLNQTHLVRLGIFHIELGKKPYFLALGMGPNFYFGDREPCHVEKQSKMMEVVKSTTNPGMRMAVYWKIHELIGQRQRMFKIQVI